MRTLEMNEMEVVAGGEGGDPFAGGSATGEVSGASNPFEGAQATGEVSGGYSGPLVNTDISSGTAMRMR